MVPILDYLQNRVNDQGLETEDEEATKSENKTELSEELPKLIEEDMEKMKPQIENYKPNIAPPFLISESSTSSFDEEYQAFQTKELNEEENKKEIIKNNFGNDEEIIIQNMHVESIMNGVCSGQPTIISKDEYQTVENSINCKNEENNEKRSEKDIDKSDSCVESVKNILPLNLEKLENKVSDNSHEEMTVIFSPRNSKNNKIRKESESLLTRLLEMNNTLSKSKTTNNISNNTQEKDNNNNNNNNNKRNNENPKNQKQTSPLISNKGNINKNNTRFTEGKVSEKIAVIDVDLGKDKIGHIIVGENDDSEILTTKFLIENNLTDSPSVRKILNSRILEMQSELLHGEEKNYVTLKDEIENLKKEQTIYRNHYLKMLSEEISQTPVATVNNKHSENFKDMVSSKAKQTTPTTKNQKEFLPRDLEFIDQISIIHHKSNFNDPQSLTTLNNNKNDYKPQILDKNAINFPEEIEQKRLTPKQSDGIINSVYTKELDLSKKQNFSTEKNYLYAQSPKVMEPYLPSKYQLKEQKIQQNAKAYEYPIKQIYHLEKKYHNEKDSNNDYIENINKYSRKKIAVKQMNNKEPEIVDTDILAALWSNNTTGNIKMHSNIRIKESEWQLSDVQKPLITSSTLPKRSNSKTSRSQSVKNNDIILRNIELASKTQQRSKSITKSSMEENFERYQAKKRAESASKKKSTKPKETDLPEQLDLYKYANTEIPSTYSDQLVETNKFTKNLHREAIIDGEKKKKDVFTSLYLSNFNKEEIRRKKMQEEIALKEEERKNCTFKPVTTKRSKEILEERYQGADSQGDVLSRLTNEIKYCNERKVSQLQKEREKKLREKFIMEKLKETGRVVYPPEEKSLEDENITFKPHVEAKSKILAEKKKRMNNFTKTEDFLYNEAKNKAQKLNDLQASITSELFKPDRSKSIKSFNKLKSQTQKLEKKMLPDNIVKSPNIILSNDKEDEKLEIIAKRNEIMLSTLQNIIDKQN